MHTIFVVGNSRSGTSMMSRMIGKHSNVYSLLHEIHFFEEQWDPSVSNGGGLSDNDANKLYSWLLCISKEGYLKPGSSTKYQKEAEKNLSDSSEKLTAINVYSLFLKDTANEHNVKFICEQTPRYLLFTKEIFKYFPESLVVNMIRDPRDIMLSQKNKWRIRYFRKKKDEIPFSEALRSWVNYHPFTTSLLWKRSAEHSLKHNDTLNFLTIRYEDIVLQPENNLKKICHKIGIMFQEEMLKITVQGSSTSQSTTEKIGVIDFREKWKKGGVSPTEIFICETVLSSIMPSFGYSISGTRPNLFNLLYLFLIFFIKTPFAILLNIGRTQNIFQSIFRRLVKTP